MPKPHLSSLLIDSDFHSITNVCDFCAMSPGVATKMNETFPTLASPRYTINLNCLHCYNSITGMNTGWAMPTQSQEGPILPGIVRGGFTEDGTLELDHKGHLCVHWGD